MEWLNTGSALALKASLLPTLPTYILNGRFRGLRGLGGAIGPSCNLKEYRRVNVVI